MSQLTNIQTRQNSNRTKDYSDEELFKKAQEAFEKEGDTMDEQPMRYSKPKKVKFSSFENDKTY